LIPYIPTERENCVEHTLHNTIGDAGGIRDSVGGAVRPTKVSRPNGQKSERDAGRVARVESVRALGRSPGMITRYDLSRGQRAGRDAGRLLDDFVAFGVLEKN
jgi:hypothetical protein